MRLIPQKLRSFLPAGGQPEEEKEVEVLDDEEYKKIAADVLQQAWTILNSKDGWKLEKSLENGDEVHSKHAKVTNKKIFKLTGTVELPPKALLEELYDNIESVPEWNPTLTECRTIAVIDDRTGISYQVCAEAAGGVVTPRDFVNLRHWQLLEGGVYVASGASIQHPLMPPQPGRVRGENGPTCWAMRPIPGDPDSCQFQWLLDTDLKGWIPQTLIDSALSGAQLDYINHIRKYSKVLRDEGKIKKTHTTNDPSN